jgi:hypothetical protein
MEPPIREFLNHWSVYFAADDADASAAEAAASGGQITVEPFNIPSAGRSPVLADPLGAVFSVLTPARAVVSQHGVGAAAFVGAQSPLSGASWASSAPPRPAIRVGRQAGELTRSHRVSLVTLAI